MVSVGENDLAENFWIPPTMARPQASFVPCSLMRGCLGRDFVEKQSKDA